MVFFPRKHPQVIGGKTCCTGIIEPHSETSEIPSLG